MVNKNLSAVGFINYVVLIFFCGLMIVLTKPTFNVVLAHLDHKVVSRLLDNVVQEGEKEKLYGVDQIYAYLQKGLDQNNIALDARDIVKAQSFGSYVDLLVDYRRDNKIFGDFYMSVVYKQTYRAKLN